MEMKFRRIVTVSGPDGRSRVAEDAQVTPGPLGIFDLWLTERVPAPVEGPDLLPGRPTRLEPPPGGSVFRYFLIPPQDPSLTPEAAERAAQAAFAAVGAAHCRVDTRLNPMMHTTRTVDYVVVLRGEVTLLLDEGKVALKPFDAVVQRGTNHYWINEGKEPALLLGVLLDAEAPQK